MYQLVHWTPSGAGDFGKAVAEGLVAHLLVTERQGGCLLADVYSLFPSRGLRVADGLAEGLRRYLTTLLGPAVTVVDTTALNLRVRKGFGRDGMGRRLYPRCW